MPVYVIPVLLKTLSYLIPLYFFPRYIRFCFTRFLPAWWRSSARALLMGHKLETAARWVRTRFTRRRRWQITPICAGSGNSRVPPSESRTNRRHADTAAARSRQCFCCGAVNLSDSNQHNLSAIQALARLSDKKASYRNFITLALGKHLVDNAPSVGVLRCSKIQ